MIFGFWLGGGGSINSGMGRLGGTHLGVYVTGCGGIKIAVLETLMLRCLLEVPVDVM